MKSTLIHAQVVRERKWKRLFKPGEAEGKKTYLTINSVS